MAYDPYDAAQNATLSPKTHYGQVHIDLWACVLEKGTGKVPFDHNVHKESDRRTAVDLTVVETDNTITRSLIAESRAWAGVTLPSIRALGVELRALEGKFVAVEFAPTGRKWTDRSGEQRDETTLKFLAIYDTEAAMLAAQGRDEEQPASAAPQSSEKTVAAAFLPALWAQSAGDVTRFSELLASNPLTGKYFTVSSPEVVNLVSGGAA